MVEHNKKISRTVPEDKFPNVLAISYFYAPDTSSGSIRNTKLIEGLSHTSVKVHVLSVRGKHPELADSDRFPGSSQPSETTTNHLKVTRTSYIDSEILLSTLKKPFVVRRQKPGSSNTRLNENRISDHHSKSKFQRLKDHISDCFRTPDPQSGWFVFGVLAGIGICRNERIDVIYAIGKPWTAFFIGYVLSRIFRKPLIVDFMDPWSQNFMQKDRTAAFRKLDRLLERFILRRADHIVANTPELARDFSRRYKLSKNQVHTITCGYDPDDFKATLGIEAESGNKFIVSHIGQFYSDRSPKTLLQAIQLLLAENRIPADLLRVRFIGHIEPGDREQNELIGCLEKKSVLEITPRIPHDKAVAHMKSANLLLVVQINAPLQVPAKLYEYMYTQKPILALCEPASATARLVESYSRGMSVAHDDVPAIAAAILEQFRLHKNTNNNPTCGDADIENYNIKNIAQSLSAIFEQATLV